jgi:sialate O-acetylesterase
MNRGVDVIKEKIGQTFACSGSTARPCPSEDDLGEQVAGWIPCTPEGRASAKPAIIRERETPRDQFAEVGYVFGREIQKELNVPIGLIKAAFGGSMVQAWTPLPGIEKEYPFDVKVEKGYVGHTPGLLYQSMIHGIVPLSMRGVVWYQGENNGRDQQYHIHMKRWIESWRKLWGRPGLPIYFVQIAPTSYAGGNMQLIWESQSWVMHNVPHTGMAVSNDIYLHGARPPSEVVSDEGKLMLSPSNPHPPNKHIVGERAANIALVKTYGKSDRTLFGPMLDSYQVDGDKITIKFKYVGSGLATRDGKAPDWFYVSEELPEGQRIFDLHHRYRRLTQIQQPAKAEIVGKDTVVVHVPEAVKEPAVVLFAWDCIAVHNLMNKEGLPAVSFRIELDPEIAARLAPSDEPK